MTSEGAQSFSGLAGRYAQALYAFADEGKTLDQTGEQIQALGQLIDASAPLRALLDSPLVDTGKARDAVLAVLDTQGFSKTVHDFVGVIANNRRLPVLRQIVRAYAHLAAERRGIVVVEVASAHALSDTQRIQMRARLAELGYGNVDLHEQVDPGLLGGLVVKIGSRLYDTSIKSRLLRLQHAMKGAA